MGGSLEVTNILNPKQKKFLETLVPELHLLLAHTNYMYHVFELTFT